MKPYLLTAAVALILTLLFMLGIYNDIALLSFVNSGAIAALLLFMFGCSLYVVNGGFFRGIIRSFKGEPPGGSIKERREKEKQLQGDDHEYQEKEKADKTADKNSVRYILTYPLVVIGVALYLITLGLAYFFY